MLKKYPDIGYRKLQLKFVLVTHFFIQRYSTWHELGLVITNTARHAHCTLSYVVYLKREQPWGGISLPFQAFAFHFCWPQSGTRTRRSPRGRQRLWGSGFSWPPVWGPLRRNTCQCPWSQRSCCCPRDGSTTSPAPPGSWWRTRTREAFQRKPSPFLASSWQTSKWGRALRYSWVMVQNKHHRANLDMHIGQ